MGMDKLSFEDRVKYVESVMPMIENCSQDPLKHREWLNFEDCWQSLSAMIELTNALKSSNAE